ncbi:hypothetical protein K7X08_024444 [Anisodus acutangulus]|uniref:Uncharacterized protein n=1 Tax=Anisodus acutangulus TaxID=402998 RepID=A0A9Q1MB48_9SOLA|nr:hypothetical protein K7X08_024444 [Anisodus acutangulus]
MTSRAGGGGMFGGIGLKIGSWTGKGSGCTGGWTVLTRSMTRVDAWDPDVGWHRLDGGVQIVVAVVEDFPLLRSVVAGEQGNCEGSGIPKAVGESSVGAFGKSLGKDLNPKANEYVPIEGLVTLNQACVDVPSCSGSDLAETLAENENDEILSYMANMFNEGPAVEATEDRLTQA